MAGFKQWFRKRLRKFLRSHGLEAKPRRGIRLPARRSPSPSRRDLAIVAIAQNEGQVLREWLEFHRLVGAEHVYLYDDGSTDKTADIVRPFVDQGFATFVPWTRFTHDIGAQQTAYAHALSAYGSNWRWMAFIDLDEYLFPVAEESLVSTLKRYEDVSAIAIPWHMFGFCGHETRPFGLVIENFTRRAQFPPSAEFEQLLKWKCIVDPLAVERVDSAHLFFMENERRGAYTEDRVWVGKKRSEGWEGVRSDVFRLNHYYTQSKEDFEARRASGRWPSYAARSPVHWERARHMAEMIESADQTEDRLILRYLPELQRRLS